MEKIIQTLDKDSVAFRDLIRNSLNQKRERAEKNQKMKISSTLFEDISCSDSSINFSPFISNETTAILSEAGHIIRSINYHGDEEKILQKRPGFIRKKFHYNQETATQKLGFKLSSKKRLRTIASKGLGFKKRVAFHMRLAWKRRKSLGLKSTKPI